MKSKAERVDEPTKAATRYIARGGELNTEPDAAAAPAAPEDVEMLNGADEEAIYGSDFEDNLI